MLTQWRVLLEVALGAAERLGRDDVERVLEVLDPSAEAGMLYSPDRYALQVTTAGLDPGDALVQLIAAWSAAVRGLDLPGGTLLRAELMTPEEFARELGDLDVSSERSSRTSLFGLAGTAVDLGGDLLRRALSDPLTGLLGREAFLHGIDGALARPGEQRVAVVCLGLDGIASLDERFGASVRDQALVDVARRLSARLRPGASLARLADDEYAVMLDNATDFDVEAVATRALDVVREPVTMSGHTIAMSGFAGAAWCEPNEDALAVVGRAEAALHFAREAANDRPVLLGPSTTPPTSLPRTLAAYPHHDPLSGLLLLLAAAAAANGADTLEDAAAAVMGQVCSHLGCAVGHLVVPVAQGSGAAKHLWRVAGSGDYGPFRQSYERSAVLAATGLFRRVASSGRPVWIRDLAAEADGPLAEGARKAGLEAAIAFPVLVGGDVVGVLEFFSTTVMEVNDSILDVLAGIGTQLGRVVERQRAAATLARVEEMLRRAERMAQIGSWYVDFRTGQTTWSHEMRFLHGLRPGESPPDLKSALERVHPADRDRAIAAVSRLLAGESTSEEFRIVRPDGTVRRHRTEASVLTDIEGGVTAICGTSQDITERNALEELLRRRERQLADGQRVAQLGWWQRDLSTGDVSWSDELYRMWGWEPGRLVTLEALLSTVHPDDRKRVLEEFTCIDPGPMPVSLDYRAIVAGGEQRWFRARKQLLVDDEGTPTTVFGTTQDVTDDKQAEKEIRELKESYQRIIETAHEGILTLDSRGFTTFANRRMAQILGYDADEMLGMPGSGFVNAETEAALIHHGERRRAGISEHYETDLVAKDGSLVRVLVSASPLVDEERQFAGTLAMVTDISALSEADEILRFHGLRPDARATGRDSRLSGS